ncbi:S41 family peptidase [Tunicatimonas pelagia]|uniref:S41 family peptidase n=1 Tax=Tunicatimonas pelagia TaxID=931531 RepID=UPI002664F75E|nr:S41 family peptidase [Tunicatimonas pelagia]WKN43522.1 S41 family peptidase [Tunicatimonas pelagia]
MKRIQQILILLLIIAPVTTFSQENISDNEKSTTIESIKKLIHTNYVFAKPTKHFNNSLDSLNLSGKYDGIIDYMSFADALTNDLVEITKDKHFKIQYNPELVKSRREGLKRQQETTTEEKIEKNSEEKIDWNLWYAKKENFGFEKVAILGGNIGYIKLNFWQPLDWVKPTIDATMGFVANTDALIIDLTENQGGYSPTDGYLASYFFNEKPTLWMSSYERRSEERESTSTFEEIGGERYLNKSVFILVSESTFSLAEQFAYAMKHFDKAIIIGQTSAGAAHAIDFMEVNDHYLIQLPVSRSIHPVTELDWEGTGVIPNIITSKNEALKTAHLKALNEQIESLKKKTIVGPILKRYEKVKTEINNR